MQIENLTGENVNELEDLIKKLKEVNPEIVHKTFPMKELVKGKTEHEMLQKILDKVEAIERKLNLIFGEYTIVDGEFKNLNEEEFECPF